jgi:hypothetical protein
MQDEPFRIYILLSEKQAGPETLALVYSSPEPAKPKPSSRSKK